MNTTDPQLINYYLHFFDSRWKGWTPHNSHCEPPGNHVWCLGMKSTTTTQYTTPWLPTYNSSSSTWHIISSSWWAAVVVYLYLLQLWQWPWEVLQPQFTWRQCLEEAHLRVNHEYIAQIDPDDPGTDKCTAMQPTGSTSCLTSLP